MLMFRKIINKENEVLKLPHDLRKIQIAPVHYSRRVSASSTYSTLKRKNFISINSDFHKNIYNLYLYLSITHNG